MEHLKTLNSAQKQAVLATEGPVLVLAGAGAGKTKTISHRVVHLVKSNVPKSSILAITFTNKAAREMRERVYSLLREHVRTTSGGTVTVSTFHAFCVILLRQYADVAGVRKNFSIYDRADSLRAVKKSIKIIEEDPKQFEPRVLLSAISRAKGDAKTLQRYREETGNAYFPIIVSKVWEEYEKILRRDNALDFDDLLLYVWKVLKRNNEVRKELSEKYRYIHVDEYQDTNKVQYEIVRFLADGHNNIFCVGDLDQNIYTWRGSTTENILKFETSFPDATVLRLEQNYRSTQNIIAVSNHIIEKNVHRKKKTLFTKNKEGEKIGLITGFDEHDEANRVVFEVCEQIEKGISPNDIAVLYRANFQSRVLEEAFLSADVPYRVLGVRFFDRKEVKDTLTYIKAALNPDSELDVTRTINTPLRGIGKVTVTKLFNGGIDALQGKVKEKVTAYYTTLENIKKKIETEKASEVLLYTLEQSGIKESLSGKGEEEEERLQNVKELVSLAVERYDDMDAPEGILRMLEDAALATDQDELDNKTEEKKDGVTLMTIHAAKGLEYDCVFITGLEEGLFPHERTASVYGGAVDEEEERRLFYVALTRAKEKVYLSYAQMRTVFGQKLTQIPSEFLLDIDETFIDTSSVNESREEKGKVVYLD